MALWAGAVLGWPAGGALVPPLQSLRTSSERASSASVCLHGRMTREAAGRSLERNLARPLDADLFVMHLKAESAGEDKTGDAHRRDLKTWLNATGRLVELVP